jgi:predicted unusual protein kinase regulating ubiquinone biosynthesis (AarF/ABC1/UbiB family)
MQSAVEADLVQLRALFALHRQMDRAIDTTEIIKEIGARVREELDYEHEARHARLYTGMLAGLPLVRVPGAHADLSTKRLLTLDWLQGDKLLSYKGASQEERNRIAEAMFKAWWLPFSRFGVIHGDPHLGNYTVFEESGEAGGINLLDYGCVRLFPTRFIGGVVDLYMGLLTNDAPRTVHAYETWGFKRLSKDLIEVLNIWARFIYGPILDDRVRTIADGVAPGEYGRKEAFKVHQELKTKGPVTVPQEFVFMDRAAIGLGGAFLHLEARLNFYAMFNAAIADFSLAQVAARQKAALEKVGLAVPV